jgi:hypothetical protein
MLAIARSNPYACVSDVEDHPALTDLRMVLVLLVRAKEVLRQSRHILREVNLSRNEKINTKLGDMESLPVWGCSNL